MITQINSYIKKYIMTLITIMLYSCSNSIYDYKTDLANQKIIINSYYDYSKDFGYPPSSLSDLVSQNYLPEYGEFYSDEIRLNIKTKPMRYSDSPYKIFKLENPTSHKILGVKNSKNKNQNWKFHGDAIEYAEIKAKQ